MEQKSPRIQSLLRPSKFANFEKGIFSKKFLGIDAEINETTLILDAATGYTDYASKSDHDLPEDDILEAFYVPFHKASMTSFHKTSSLRYFLGHIKEEPLLYTPSHQAVIAFANPKE